MTGREAAEALPLSVWPFLPVKAAESIVAAAVTGLRLWSALKRV